MPLPISSLQNGRIKNIVKLSNRRQRDRQQITVVEGIREVSRALQNGIVPREAYLCPELLPPEADACVQTLYALEADGKTQLFELPTAVFAKTAYRGNSGGLLLLIPYLQRPLSQIPLSTAPFLVVVEGVEKPGNLGAILRTGDAAGVDGLIISQASTGSGTDFHNPNAVRASLGTLFTVPIASASTADTIDWLKAQHIRIVIATPEAETGYTAVDLRQPTAIVTGSEAFGLSESWPEAADEQVTIPMFGQADSLNLSTATAVLLYEVVRQRNSPNTRN